MEASSEASYYEGEPWEEWGSRSTLSQLDEAEAEPQPPSARRYPSAAAERDALLRALAAERARASAAARAHDARLAELHGVIAELVRRRAADRARAIEEEGEDECESTTQPAGELDNDGDNSRTEQNDSTSLLSPDADPSLADAEVTDPGAREEIDLQAPQSDLEVDLDLKLEEKDSELCLNTARCCQTSRQAPSLDSCSREHGSADGKGREQGSLNGKARLCPVSPGRCESRQAKVASRVRLKRTEEKEGERVNGECWCLSGAEQLALELSAQADHSEAAVSARHGDAANALAWRLRCSRLQAECSVLQCAVQRATDTAHRLSVSCALQESSCVTVCAALSAADRALEVYDVLLALAETRGTEGEQRVAAERVANQLLARLEGEGEGGRSEGDGTIGRPLLSPGPWLDHDAQAECASEWTAEREELLRSHAARLKADTVALRALRPPPKLFSYHESEESSGSGMAEMETAVEAQEALAMRELERAKDNHRHCDQFTGSGRSGGRRDRHWLDAASETDL